MSDTLQLLGQALLECLKGVPLTLGLTAISVCIGFFMAIGLSIVMQKPKSLAARCTKGFIYFFTGTPLLIQLYIFYYGIPSWSVIGNLMNQPGFDFLKEAYLWVLLALTLNTAAYSTVIFSGAIKNMDHREVEAALSFGMSRWQAMKRIIMPSSLRRALPAYSNEVVMTMHSTALASTVTLLEITGRASLFNSTYYQPFIAYAAAGVLYFILNGLLIYGFRRLERHFLKHLHVVQNA